MQFALHAMPRASLSSAAVSATPISAFSVLAAEPTTSDRQLLDAVEAVGNRPSYWAPLSHIATKTDTPITGGHRHVTDHNHPGAPRTALATFRIDYIGAGHV